MEIHISIAPETLFTVGPLHVTNSLLTMFLVMGFLLIVGSAIARSAKLIPGRWQGIFEVVTDFLLQLTEGTGGREFGRRIFPLIGAIFMFIALANYSGILPGIGTIGYYPAEAEHIEAGEAHEGEDLVVEPVEEGGVAVEEAPETTAAATAADDEHHVSMVPIFRPPNADLNMTLAMALVTFTTIQVMGVRAHGVGGRLKHMADPPFLFPIEVISEFGRIISLSARLFGNVFAGEVLLAVMYALANAVKIAVIPLLVPVVFILLELLFGTIQALVFALLTAVYITLAAGDHGSHDHEDHAHADDAHHTPDQAPMTRVPAGAGD